MFAFRTECCSSFSTSLFCYCPSPSCNQFVLTDITRAQESMVGLQTGEKKFTDKQFEKANY